MIYLTNEDLYADTIQRFIDESLRDHPDAKEKAELTAISTAKSYLSRRYNTALIFDEETPIIDPVLVEILVKITLYKILGRNAARKVPTDVKDDFEWAIKQLEKLNAGRLKIELPPALDDQGEIKSTSMHGNNRNQNYYI